MTLEQNIEAIKSILRREVPIRSPLLNSYINNDEDAKKIEADKAETRKKVDRATGADKIEQSHV